MPTELSRLSLHHMSEENYYRPVSVFSNLSQFFKELNLYETEKVREFLSLPLL
jgi:hypothetical protein